MYFSFSSWGIGLVVGTVVFGIFGIGLIGGLWWTRRLGAPRWAAAMNIFWGAFIVFYLSPVLGILGAYSFEALPLAGIVVFLATLASFLLGAALIFVCTTLERREHAARTLARYSIVHHTAALLVLALLLTFLDEAETGYFVGAGGVAIGAVLASWLRARLPLQGAVSEE